MSYNAGAIPKSHGGARPKTKSGYKAPQSNLDKSKFVHGMNINNEKLISKGGDISNSSISPPLKVAKCPLEKQEITVSEGGVHIIRKSLNQHFVEKKTFISYIPPPHVQTDQEVIGALEAWIEQMEFMINDLSWLLGLPYHRFWSQMVYDQSAHECLESYLGNGPRWYDKLPDDESCQSVVNKIHQLVFLIYVRMATHKESTEDFITTEHFGNLVYDYFLFDLCKVLDMCVLYGSTNGPLLEKMLTNIFTHQPKYSKDLDQLVISLEEVLNNLQLKLLHSESPFCARPITDELLTLEELDDITQYLLDTFSSLHSFLSVFNDACISFHKKEFELKMCAFYEKIIPFLVDKLFLVVSEYGEGGFAEELSTKMNSMRTHCVAVFRLILQHSCIPTVGDKSLREKVSSKMETFIQTISTCAEDKVFIADYSSTYDIDQDISVFQKCGADMTTLDFVRAAVSSAVADVEACSHVWNFTKDGNQTEQKSPEPENEVQVKPEVDAVPDSSGMNGYYKGETAEISDIELASLISSVQDLLQDLGAGFVKQCLKYYNHSTEEVLNALLEDNLPPTLSSLDRTLTLSQIETPQTTPRNNSPVDMKQPNKPTFERELSSQSDVLVNRANLYDDDEFDVFSSRPTQIKNNNIFKGKRKDTGKEKDKDSSLVNKMKAIAMQYDTSSGYSIYEDEEKYLAMANDYDDEYDDTYDDNETGDIDNFSNDKRRRPAPTFRGKGALNTPGLNFMGDDSSDEKGGEVVEESSDWKQTQFKKANASARRDYTRSAKEPRHRREPEADFSSSRQNPRGSNEEQKQGSSQFSGQSLVFNNHSRRKQTSQNAKNSPREQNSSEKDNDCNPDGCSQDTRRRAERKKMNQNNNEQETPVNSNDVRVLDGGNQNGFVPRHKPQSNKSGKSWRQGNAENDEDNRRYGGKQKEDTNHGKAQDQNHKYKMIHKNDQRKKAAQAKYRNNL